MVVDTKGTQHLLLFWQWPQIFGRYNFRETHGPSRILDGPIRCIFRHSCPFWLCSCCSSIGTWLSNSRNNRKYNQKINIKSNMKSSVKGTLLTARSIYVNTINKSHFCHNCFVGWNLNILIIRNTENRLARDKNEIKTKETCWLTRTRCLWRITAFSFVWSVLSKLFLIIVLFIIFWQRRFWHKRIGLSFLQPTAVSTLRVETPIPQLSEHDVHGLAETFWHVAFTILQFKRKKIEKLVCTMKIKCGGKKKILDKFNQSR